MLGDFAFKLRVLRYLLSNALSDWKAEVWRKDLDAQSCCDGRECCCGGETNRQMWSWHTGDRR